MSAPTPPADTCHGAQRLDLRPPVSCLGEAGKVLPHGKSGVLEFDQLVGRETRPHNLFTCTRRHAPTPLEPRPYQHTAARARDDDGAPREAPAQLADVAIGMTVAGEWVTGWQRAPRARLDAMSAAELCMLGESPLACARNSSPLSEWCSSSRAAQRPPVVRAASSASARRAHGTRRAVLLAWLARGGAASVVLIHKRRAASQQARRTKMKR